MEEGLDNGRKLWCCCSLQEKERKLLLYLDHADKKTMMAFT